MRTPAVADFGELPAAIGIDVRIAMGRGSEASQRFTRRCCSSKPI
jgi:hypothetical protein